MSADICSLLNRQVALPTEAWQGAEIHRGSEENGYIYLPGSHFLIPILDRVEEISERVQFLETHPRSA